MARCGNCCSRGAKRRAEDRQPMSLGIAASVKLQSERDNVVREFKPFKEGGKRFTGCGLAFLGINQDQNIEGVELFDGEAFKPHKDRCFRFLNLTMVKGIFLILVLSAIRVVNDANSPNSSPKS